MKLKIDLTMDRRWFWMIIAILIIIVIYMLNYGTTDINLHLLTIQEYQNCSLPGYFGYPNYFSNYIITNHTFIPDYTFMPDSMHQCCYPGETACSKGCQYPIGIYYEEKGK